MTLLVVNLGLPKTGTTTLARALRRSGLSVADHRLRAGNAGDPALLGAYVAELMYRGYFETGDPGALLAPCNAISEASMLNAHRSLWPQMDFALILALRAHHPGVRFLASRRDAFDLSQSMLAWADMAETRLPANAVPGLPSGYGLTTKERVQWINGHYDALAQFFAGDPDYLEYDVADPDAREKIAAFLGRKMPWWGRANANPIRKSRGIV